MIVARGTVAWLVGVNPEHDREKGNVRVDHVNKQEVAESSGGWPGLWMLQRPYRT
jgi:hypothetical protein